MKTMRTPKGKIVRVDDDKASLLYEEGFRYASKEMWKSEVRDVDIIPKEDDEKVKSNKPSKAQKRHYRKTT